MFGLVRTGHARDKRSWDGADQDRPLNARGRQQALGVVEHLAALQPERLLSSPTARARQTLDPLAIHTHLPVRPAPELLPGADAQHLDRLILSGWGDRAVLCTHGHVLRHLLGIWARRQPAVRRNGDWPADGRAEKGAALLVDTEADIWTVHYFRPLHVGPVLSALPGDID